MSQQYCDHISKQGFAQAKLFRNQERESMEVDSDMDYLMIPNVIWLCKVLKIVKEKN
jgi:hypothetical protein